MEKDGPQTRGRGLCKHEDIVLTRYLVLRRGLKWHQTQGRAERGLGVMSMQGPRDTRFPFAMTGHLVMVEQKYLKTRQLLLSSSMHPCNRVTLFLACLISSSAISMRFFLKATTRLPLKLVSSFFPDSESLSNFFRQCC